MAYVNSFTSKLAAEANCKEFYFRNVNSFTSPDTCTCDEKGLVLFFGRTLLSGHNPAYRTYNIAIRGCPCRSA